MDNTILKHAPLAAKLPPELRERRNFVTWRIEKSPGKDKPTKVPYNPHTGVKASSTNPDTWSTYDVACAASESRGHDGIGFMFGNSPYAGVDFDHCRNPETGAVEPWAQDYIDRLNSYTEISPSGTGIHILVKAVLPEGRRKKGNIEMYDTGRYFTLTGNHIIGTLVNIEERQEVLTAIHTEVFGTAAKDRQHQPTVVRDISESDTELIALARAAKNGSKFAALWDGGLAGNPSRSEADIALCNLLAFWTGHDGIRIDHLFRQSGLYREKWDEKHYGSGQTYGQHTIQKAMEGCTEVYTPRVQKVKFKNSGNGEGNSQQTDFTLTDDGNAERLVHLYGDRIRYCHEKGWMVYDGCRWDTDRVGQVRQFAVHTVHSIAVEAANLNNSDRAGGLLSHASKSLSESRVRAMISSAESKKGIACVIEDFDADPMLLNVLNGVLDLHTGELKEHDPALMLTQLAPVNFDPEATAPVWDEFLGRIMDHKKSVIDFLQRAIGYTLTGRTDEECVFICHGGGANGKSTLLDTISRLMGDYAKQTQTETLMQTRRSDGPTNDLARLRGCRLAVASETEQGQYLAEAKIKNITGGEKITARFLNKEFFEFMPMFKIWMGANHKPQVKGTDDGIWRRIKLIPFNVQIPVEERDAELKGPNGKLATEMSGILNWILKGCQTWLANGLDTPAEVLDATSEYRSESDILRNFLEEVCHTGGIMKTTVADLHKIYECWCRLNGEDALGKMAFGNRLRLRGYKTDSTSGTACWCGMEIRPEWTGKVKVIQGEKTDTF